MGGGVMNSDYESEELLSLDESSSSSEHCEVSSDGETPTAEVDNFVRRSRYPIFRPVAKAKNLRFVKDMLFLSPKQFKDAMSDYAVHAEHDLATGLPYFERIYIFLEGCKKGFLAGCRPVIGLDACHLKTKTGGILIKDLFWKATKATYQQAWERAMNELKEVDEDAFKWMQSHSKTIWARSMFKSDGQSDIVLNNMCESFNSRILKFKSKPIIAMPPIKRRPPDRPKKKMTLEPDEPRSHRKNRGVGISKQCKACGKLGHNRRSCNLLITIVSLCSCLCLQAAKDGHANSPAVGSAQPGSNARPTLHRAQPSFTDDVTTTAPPPYTDNQSNPRLKRQRKRSAVTIVTLNASRNAARSVQDRKETLQEVDEFLNTKTAPKKLVNEIKVRVQGSAGVCAMQCWCVCSAGAEVVQCNVGAEVVRCSASGLYGIYGIVCDQC
ncbi:hypothetical protein SO802_033212 [Lithocarpus litseifolius]|uniref:CCHC-type domain-containing protein n=1 Tax=Lithocarpus litseifolius TaxID=425828 RepID=A0AAW2BED3_9ROSI